MTALAAGLDYVDLHFLGKPGIIATAVLHGPGGVALIDPGPSTSIDNLRAALKQKGIAVGDVRQLLLTHIHLDHAGAAGSLVKENSTIEVFVHERGAPHMVHPERLLQSAGRLYGQDMDRLWGEFLPVPEQNLQVLKGGETVTAAGRRLEVAHTPGHASHHVSYFDPPSSVAFVGDTAGIRRAGSNYVMPPTPPPDVDLEAWLESENRILAWNPDSLFLTHFGPVHGPRIHFQQLRDNITAWSRITRQLIADTTLDEARRQQLFVEEASLALRRAVGDAEADRYSRAGRLDYSWQGLARYWRKKSSGT